ncbi:hypothetical protein ACP70R_042398 [Stipagrostis hirtigluma subsp. patula]
MAAMRSAFAMLGRRSSGSAASSAAATMAGGGREIRQVFGSAPPLPPSIRPAGRDLEILRHFSTEGKGPADEKDESLRMRFKGYIERMRNGDIVERARSIYVCSMVTLGLSSCYLVKNLVEMYQRR